jgi:hypothetical protein
VIKLIHDRANEDFIHGAVDLDLLSFVGVTDHSVTAFVSGKRPEQTWAEYRPAESIVSYRRLGNDQASDQFVLYGYSSSAHANNDTTDADFYLTT